MLRLVHLGHATTASQFHRGVFAEMGTRKFDLRDGGQRWAFSLLIINVYMIETLVYKFLQGGTQRTERKGKNEQRQPHCQKRTRSKVARQRGNDPKDECEQGKQCPGQ